MIDSASIARARALWFGSLVVAVAGLVALYPVLHHGFLQVGFDDPGFVTEVATIGPWSWQRLWMCFDRFYLYDYVPLPMLSFLLEYQLWGLDPSGYHATNLLLHMANALLVQRWVTKVSRCAAAGILAGVVFAVHPVQVEAVAIVAQRKTVLSTFFLLLALLAYGRYQTSGKTIWLAGSVSAFAAACLSKSSVVPFPFLLLLYDWLVDRGFDWRSKLAYFALAAATAVVSMLAKVGTVVKAPHGESFLVTALVMSRVWWEYVVALFAPLDLSPAYYYRRGEIGSLANYAALAALVGLLLIVWRVRDRARATAFCLAWILLSLLPVSNIVPIAVLRADRYLYLPMIAFAFWVGSGIASVRRSSVARRAQIVAAVFWCAGLAWESSRYAGVFRDDVTAYSRAVERHPWAAPAHYLLALAWVERGDWQQARTSARAALERDPGFARARELLAQLDAATADPHLGGEADAGEGAR